MACPFVAYSSKDKRGKRPSMHSSPPRKSGTFCSLRMSRGMPKLLDTSIMHRGPRSKLHRHLPLYCSAGKVGEGLEKRNPGDILLATRLVCGWRGESRPCLSLSLQCPRVTILTSAAPPLPCRIFTETCPAHGVGCQEPLFPPRSQCPFCS